MNVLSLPPSRRPGRFRGSWAGMRNTTSRTADKMI